MSSFAKRVAVVTGAGSGIGQALSIALGRRGARLAISDVSDDGLADTAAQLAALVAPTHAQRLDVSDREAVQAYATKEFLPHLIASGCGHVINISSLNGIMGQPSMTGYCASKFAVRGFTESLRAEMIFNDYPVRVSVVHPGGVKTNIATAALAEAGESSNEHTTRARIYNEKLLKLPEWKAADIIVDGVAANKPRIIVGNDARLVDLMVRLLPRAHPRLSAWWARRLFAE